MTTIKNIPPVSLKKTLVIARVFPSKIKQSKTRSNLQGCLSFVHHVFVWLKTPLCFSKYTSCPQWFIFILSFFSLTLSNCNRTAQTTTVTPANITLNPAQLLGKKLFFDTNLSNPPGQSCATCHVPNHGFSDPEQLPASRGAVKTLFGTRNAPTVAYAAFTPYFHFDSSEGNYIGGLFWDGRSATLSEQAMNPLLTHNEMNNMNKKMVVDHVQQADYKDLFLQVFGTGAFNNVDEAFENIAEAIEEFEETAEVNPFTSKFDYYLKGETQLTEQELRGMKLFNDTAKGNCAACHPSTPDPFTGAVLFTDFTYDNLGIPANTELHKMCNDSKPDSGLGPIVKQNSENGKFKVPTLRNVAVTAPYFHNGFSKTLEDVMDFYNTRDKGTFGKPEISENVNTDELGNLTLTKQEADDIIAFMKTLTDGYKPVTKQTP